MPASDASTPRWRVAFAALAIALLGLTLAAFYRFGSASTDENLFTTPTAPVYLLRAVGSGSTEVPAGSFVLRVGDRPMRAFEDWASAVAGLAEGDAPVRVAYSPHDDRGVRREQTVTARDVRAARVRDATRGALVVAVTAGGASDRAGMRVGDLITRIGGKGFDTIFEADAIMRGGGVGRSYEYEVLRAGEPVTLHVVLARFGVPLPILFWYGAGLAWMLFGGWLLWMRPSLAGARLLGLAFLLVGFGLSLLLLRRGPGQGLTFVLLTALPALAVLAGVAAFSHASVYFPREWPSLTRARWLPLALYGGALAGWLLMGVRPSNALFGGTIVALTLVGAVARRRHAHERPAEDRSVRRVVTWAGFAATLTAMLVLFGPFVLGTGVPIAAALLQAVALVAFPLAYLYTLGRYHVFDLQLRVRRNVQYSVVSFVWAAIPFAVLVFLLWTLPQADLRLPRVRMTASSLELMEDLPAPRPLGLAVPTPPQGLGPPAAPGDSNAPFEKGVLMVVAIALAFGLREVAVRGQRVLATKFHRGGYDYRRAAQAIAEVTGTRLDLEGLTTGVLDVLVTLLPLKRAGLLLAHGSRFYCASHAHGFGDEEWKAFCRQWADEVLAAMRDARGEMSAEYAPPRIGDTLRAAEIGYLYPLRSRDALVGVLFIGEKQSESAFQNADFEFVGAIASQVAGNVENAFLYEDLAEQERLRHELQIARQIQLASLPQFTPRVRGLEVAGVSMPALEVGGDYFDYLDGRPDRLTVMVGDVSGKGTSAALHMSRLQGIVRSLHDFDLAPRELFVRTNQLISRDLERRAFVTALGGFFDAGRRVMVLARAGHLPLYHYCARSGEVARLLPRGIGFGLAARAMFEAELEEHTVAYAPGDVFLFVTDGVTECQDAGGELFGEQRLAELLAQEAGRQAGAAELRDAVAEEVRRFAGDTDPYDDQTVVVVRAV